MKRVSTFTLFFFILSLAACGDQSDAPSDADNQILSGSGALIAVVIRKSDSSMIENATVWVEGGSSCVTVFNGNHNIECSIGNLPVGEVLTVGVEVNGQTSERDLIIPESEPTYRVILVDEAE